MYAHEHIEWLSPITDEAIITIHWSTWFGFGRTKVKRYRGSSSVWYDIDTRKRCSLSTEKYLESIWTTGRWDR